MNDFSINHDNVMATAGDDGSINFWDYKSGFRYQQLMSKVQPGSLSSENGIFACLFDKCGDTMLNVKLFTRFIVSLIVTQFRILNCVKNV